MSSILSRRYGPLVLLVEDSAADAQLVRLAIEEFDIEAELMHFKDGEGLLAYLSTLSPEAAERQPKLILLDINLPRISGIELLKKLRDEPLSQFIPVVILSSSSNHRDLERAFLAGANSYVLKEPDFLLFGEQVKLLTSYWFKLNQQPQR
jgi:CheY-like chemotaxis protein